MGEARRGAPVGGGSGNGVNRPGPSPTSPPSGGGGPGVGLGEVLQGPKGAPPRPAVVRVRLRAAAAFPVAPCRGADHNGGADRLRPRRPMGHGLGPGGHGPPPWRAGEPVAAHDQHVLHAPVGQFGAHVGPEGGPLIGLDPDAQHVLNSPSTAAPTAMWAARLETWWSARTLTRIASGVDHGVERLQRPALPLQDGVAHRVGDLRGPSPLRSTPIVDARWWRISRTVMPGRTS